MNITTARLVDIDPANFPDKNAYERALRDASRGLFAFLMGLHNEVGVGTPNPGKAMQGIYDTLTSGAVIVAERDGELVGSLGLYATELWYADSAVLSELWFWIAPDHRDGEALEAILRVLANTCDAIGAYAEIKINNPHRKRVPRTRLERIGAALSYQPRGGAFVMPPE